MPPGIALRRILDGAAPSELALVARLAGGGGARSPSAPAPIVARKRLERLRKRLAAQARSPGAFPRRP